MRTPFMYLESRLDEQIVLAGATDASLTSVEGRLRIRLKKVELVNCDAALPSIQLFLSLAAPPRLWFERPAEALRSAAADGRS